MSLHDSLNAAQKRAAEITRGPLLIIAGAGAGKTKTMIHRILALIESGVPGREIVAITFTNKAATEMRMRVQALLAQTPYARETPWLSTFHALGVHILRENAEIMGLSRSFTILDRDEALSLLKTALKEIGFDPKQHEPSKLLSAISKQKGELVTPESMQAKAESRGNTVQTVSLVWPRYEALKAKQKALDFDDLLVRTVQLFKKHPDILDAYQERWKYIHIDEYQDTNTAQYEISRLLAAKYKNICVIGDADQTIYSWRGANFRNILNFEKDYPQTEIVTLEENYRSTKNILDAANHIIKKNVERREKNLFTQKGPGKPIELTAAFSETDEARSVADHIIELIDGGVSPKHIAILYRANFQSRALEEALLRMRIPYQLLGTRFYDRKEIKDVIAFLRLAENPDDTESLKRVINIPPRGIGATTLGKIIDGEEAGLPAKMKEKLTDFRAMISAIRDELPKQKMSDLISYIITKTRFEEHLSEDDEQERVENLRELISIATRYDDRPGSEGVLAFLTDASLMSDQDTMKEERDSVRMMTVHAAKGLEFRHVFVTGLEQDLFPHKRFDEASIGREREEEERRLFYVAITRAEEALYLSYAQSRMVFGSRGMNMPSEYISDIPKHLIKASEGVAFHDDSSDGVQREQEEVIQWDIFDKFKKR